MKLHRYDLGYDLDALRADAERAVSGWDWSRGAHGHALSLPHSGQLHPAARYRYQNSPATGRLERCPYFREIFESFASPKISFRLLRREAGTSYAWHNDRWKGAGVSRFQIPISTDHCAVLALTEFENTSELPDTLRTASGSEIESLAREEPERLEVHRLDAGVLYHFDTRHVHTLFNESPDDRLVLSFDVVVDEALLERFPEVREEVGEAPPPPRSPSPPELALGYCLSRLHPLRALAQRAMRARS